MNSPGPDLSLRRAAAAAWGCLTLLENSYSQTSWIILELVLCIVRARAEEGVSTLRESCELSRARELRVASEYAGRGTPARRELTDGRGTSLAGLGEFSSRSVTDRSAN